MNGDLITLDIQKDGLHIILEPLGREYLESMVEHRPTENEVGGGWIVWKGHYDAILPELLEWYASNGGPELLSEYGSDYNDDYTRIGALTSAPIIAYDVERNDQNDLVSVGRVFWFPDYMVESELETLLIRGEVTFPEAE